MSGICGCCRLDGTTSTAAELQPVLHAMASRGPDGLQVWQDGPITLGHALLITDAAASRSSRPLPQRRGKLTITADVRLDNRDELLRELGLGATAARFSDTMIILEAYRSWGENCCERFLGDFAFAIWDEECNQLFCARDHMGMRQLAYCFLPGRIFVFATDSEALVEHPDVPSDLNLGRIADFFETFEGLDWTSTFYKHVFRLPPAHTLTLSVDGGDPQLKRYWTLENPPELSLSSDEEYSKAFLEVFDQAVRCRFRGDRVGALLSGGLDSSSMVAVASKIAGERARIHTFSATAPTGVDCPETHAIEQVLSLHRPLSTKIHYADLGDYEEDLLNILLNKAQPFDGHMALVATLYLSAKRHGIRVLLDGVAADIVLTAGNNVARQLQQNGFAAAWREAQQEEKFWGPTWPATSQIAASAWTAFAPRFLRDLKQRLVLLAQNSVVALGLRNLKPQFARAVSLPTRRKHYHEHIRTRSSTDRGYRLRSVNHPHLVAARERYDRIAAACGVEPRDPFMDIRLIRFCLSLPPSQLQRDGWPKFILRNSVATLLPDAVRWRRGKMHLGPQFTASLVNYLPKGAKDSAELNQCLSPFASKRFKKRLTSMDSGDFFGQVVLAAWLRRHSTEIVPSVEVRGT